MLAQLKYMYMYSLSLLEHKTVFLSYLHTVNKPGSVLKQYHTLCDTVCSLH